MFRTIILRRIEKCKIANKTVTLEILHPPTMSYRYFAVSFVVEWKERKEQTK